MIILTDIDKQMLRKAHFLSNTTRYNVDITACAKLVDTMK
jgi:hypothetical protein